MSEEIQMEEGTKTPTIGDYIRSGSCIGDPKVRLFYNIIYIYNTIYKENAYHTFKADK